MAIYVCFSYIPESWLPSSEWASSAVATQMGGWSRERGGVRKWGETEIFRGVRLFWGDWWVIIIYLFIFFQLCVCLFVCILNKICKFKYMLCVFIYTYLIDIMMCRVRYTCGSLMNDGPKINNSCRFAMKYLYKKC